MLQKFLKNAYFVSLILYLGVRYTMNVKNIDMLLEKLLVMQKNQRLQKFSRSSSNGITKKWAQQETVADSITELQDITRGYGPVDPCSKPYPKVYYTFDFSEQMCLLHHSRQMSPLYFLVPRKVQLFRVIVDKTQRQYNYLVVENETIFYNFYIQNIYINMYLAIKKLSRLINSISY